MITLNVIGAGKVARVLARLWYESGQFKPAGVLTRSVQTATAAAAFIGAGRPWAALAELPPARCWMIGVNDDEIAGVAGRLAALGRVRNADLVFHLSGALAADALAPLRAQGAATASLHPLKSFPEAEAAYRSFAGTPVALEGDPSACEALAASCAAIGAITFQLQGEQKLYYHAATSILCNYLSALLDVGLEVYELAGIERARAATLVTPLLREALANGLRWGPEATLTGPIARGDSDIVAAHLRVLPDSLKGVYRELGRRALRLATAAGRLTPDQSARLSALLNRRPKNTTPV